MRAGRGRRGCRPAGWVPAPFFVTQEEKHETYPSVLPPAAGPVRHRSGRPCGEADLPRGRSRGLDRERRAGRDRRRGAGGPGQIRERHHRHRRQRDHDAGQLAADYEQKLHAARVAQNGNYYGLKGMAGDLPLEVCLWTFDGMHGVASIVGRTGHPALQGIVDSLEFYR